MIFLKTLLYFRFVFLQRRLSSVFLCFLLLLATNAYSVVRLSGTITHPIADSIKISYNDNKLAYYPKEFYALVDKNGYFSIAFPLPSGIYLQAEITHGNHLAEVMLYDGDSLHLSADTRRFDSSIHYNGTGSEVQNFVALHTITRGRLNQYTLRVKNILGKEPEQFYAGIEEERKKEEDFANKSQYKLPPLFKKIWLSHFEYYNYFFLQQYPLMHQMMNLQRYTDTVPPENYTVLKHMPQKFNDDLLQVPSYLLYLTGVFESKLKAAGLGFPSSDTQKARILLDSIIALGYKNLPKQSSEYCIAQGLYARIRVQQLSRTKQELYKFTTSFPSSQYLPFLQKQLDIVERLSPGMPAPDFQTTTLSGITVHLSSLKDTVVYVTFWASWCKQCVGEMRMMERKVKQSFLNKPVRFVYVSLDEDTTLAKQVTNQFKVAGYHTYTSGSWYADVAVKYGIQALPAYFLVDRKGRFALSNPPTPQRPTDLIVAISRLY